MDDKTNSVSLVLGSGGARGLAHIGIIRYLDANGYKIESVSGCSMGALVGGIYAAGKLDEYEAWVKKIDKFDIFSLLDFTFGRSGLVKGDKLIANLSRMVGDVRIEDLPVAFTAVAADITREREVWISKGPLFDAIRASISLPLFFTPFEYKGVKLLDGGIFNPVPMAPTYHDVTDMTIAVNLIGPMTRESELSDTVGNGQNEQEDFGDKFKAFLTRLIPDSPGKDGDWDFFYIASQSFDAMQGVIARQKLAAHPPDVTIEIPRNACGILEFDRAEEMVELGYRRAEEALNHYRKS